MGVLSVDPLTLAAIEEMDISQVAGGPDVDSHEMIPTHHWVATFGDEAQVFVDNNENPRMRERQADNSLYVDPDVVDDGPIDEQIVWTQKGPRAPGAMDMSRRSEVMDVMGIGRQLVFPTFGLMGMALYAGANDSGMMNFDTQGRDARSLGRWAVDAYNEWAIRWTRNDPHDRVRPVAVLRTDGTVDELLEHTRDVIEAGSKALWIPVGMPPAGRSPADAALDPWWDMIAAADVAALSHVGTEFMMFASLAWGAGVPAFAPADMSMVEFPIQPHFGSTVNMPAENYLAAMVLGGVFEHHPTLRYGVIETGAQWVGPLAERLDLWAGEFAGRLGDLSLKPSEYLNRNVRVTPFLFEDVELYYQRYPDLADVYCYSSDYPHVEGGKYSKARFYKKLEHCGDEVVRKFFLTNGEHLLPGRRLT